MIDVDKEKEKRGEEEVVPSGVRMAKLILRLNARREKRTGRKHLKYVKSTGYRLEMEDRCKTRNHKSN